jgi:adenosylhomocysteine nucleosidase
MTTECSMLTWQSPEIAEFLLWPAILRHTRGLAASPRVRYMLKVERSFSPFLFRPRPTMTAVIALLCAMPLELRPLRRRLHLRKTQLGHVGRIGERQVVATVSGVGTALARAATVRLLDAVDIDWAIVVGIAGALGNQIPIGTLVFPDLVVDGADGSVHRPTPLRVAAPYGKLLTTDELLLDQMQHADLRRDGVLALDMETAAVAKVCGERDVPWSVVRGISDRAGDGTVDAEIFGLTRADGQPNLPAAGRYLVRHPGGLARLVRLGRGSRLAAERAADAAITAVSTSINS